MKLPYTVDIAVCLSRKQVDLYIKLHQEMSNNHSVTAILISAYSFIKNNFNQVFYQQTHYLDCDQFILEI